MPPRCYACSAARAPARLAEVAAPLDLPRPTAHGILRTARGRVRRSGPDTAATPWPPACAGWAGMNHHDLRSRAMNWADSLRRARGKRYSSECRRAPWSSWSTTSSGPKFRRSACGPASSSRCTRRPSASACSPSLRSGARPHELDLQRYTGRTVVAVGTLTAQLATAQQRGWAGKLGEHRTGVGGLAAPVRTGGGLVVGALGVEGPVEELFGGGGTPVPGLVEQLLDAAREISAGLGVTRSASSGATSVTARPGTADEPANGR